MYLYARLAARGAVAGILGSVVQTGIGLALGLTGASPLPLGGIGSALVYLAAFSSKGVGTITLTEPPPRARGWRKQGSLVAVSTAFALASACLNDRLARRSRRCA